MAEQAVSIGFGKETFPSISASLAVFAVSDGFQRVTPGKVYPRQGKMQVFPASKYPEVNGQFYLDTLKVPDGVIILLQSSHKAKAVPLRDGGVFIATRATGPMLAINANIPSAVGSLQRGGFLTFQGRGDILMAEDLEGYGIVPPNNWINGFMDEEEVAECYTITVMAPALEGKPSFEIVEDRDGNAVRALAKPRRRLSLRRT